MKASTVFISQNKICIVSIVTSQARKEKKNKILYLAVKIWGQLQLTFDNAKSEEGQTYYKDKIQKSFKTMSAQVIEYEFM